MLSSDLLIKISWTVIKSSHLLKPAMFSGVTGEDERLTLIWCFELNVPMCFAGL